LRPVGADLHGRLGERWLAVADPLLDMHPVGVDPEERLLPPTRAAEHQLERRVGDLERVAARLAALQLFEQRTHVALCELQPELGSLHPERRGTAEIARDDAAVVADRL